MANVFQRAIVHRTAADETLTFQIHLDIINSTDDVNEISLCVYLLLLN